MVYCYYGIAPRVLKDVVAAIDADSGVVDKPDNYDYEYRELGTGCIKVHYDSEPSGASKTALDSYMSGIGYNE